MKIIISPAKKLTTEKINISNPSVIQFSTEAKYLVEQLRNYSVKNIKKLMGLSDNLAKLNHERFQHWDLKSKEVNPAIYIFQGDVYKGLKANQFEKIEDPKLHNIMNMLYNEDNTTCQYNFPVNLKKKMETDEMLIYIKQLTKWVSRHGSGPILFKQILDNITSKGFISIINSSK